MVKVASAEMMQLGHRPNVLVVAPEAGARRDLAASLSHGGCHVTPLSTGAAAVRILDACAVDLVVVDRDTPDLERVGRQRPAYAERPPVLCVTACEFLGELVPVLGTRIEDYVTKPWHVAELLARAQVLLRGRGAPARADVLRHGDLLLDDAVGQAWRAGRALDLTPAEYRLLRHLLLNAGRVLSKGRLARLVWDEDRAESAIERMVSRLRQKVDRAGPTVIHTHRGVGYRLGFGK